MSSEKKTFPISVSLTKGGTPNPTACTQEDGFSKVERSLRRSARFTLRSSRSTTVGRTVDDVVYCSDQCICLCAHTTLEAVITPKVQLFRLRQQESQVTQDKFRVAAANGSKMGAIKAGMIGFDASLGVSPCCIRSKSDSTGPKNSSKLFIASVHLPVSAVQLRFQKSSSAASVTTKTKVIGTATGGGVFLNPVRRVQVYVTDAAP
ncbi:hypothetical protein F2P81_019870 [Scophthalmus maximus]|uniref:Uncharacterized protein n=1 Tax=Scophthalmus maximus TaxID=52904 RepID=A0A6A4S3N9_SCOMX|nr:hypothetical protein F2P81_019870 [Scophthalmus maximus]